MSKSINSITIIITLEGNEKMKTSENDNKSVWVKSREHLHVEWLLFFVLFPWKSCNVNCRSCQGLMAASGMIQTPWYSKDHSSQNLSETETTQSLTKFFKNNIFHIRWKLCRWNEKKKTRKLKKLPILAKKSKHVTSFLFGNVEVSGVGDKHRFLRLKREN